MPSTNLRDLRIIRPPGRPICLPEDPCPCGSGAAFGGCCRRSDGSAFRSQAFLIPPGAKTGARTAGCYLGWADDCAGPLTDEHYVSQNVLSAVSDGVIVVSGFPWLKTGEVREIPIMRLSAKVLCKRHNEAL